MQIVVKDGGFLDRGLSRLGLTRSSQIRSESFAAGGYNRLNWDWATSILSADLEIRSSLYALRARSRELVRNNAHAMSFINEARKNVIGSTGVTLQAALDPDTVPGADRLNDLIEGGWQRWSENVTTDGRLSLTDAAGLWLESFIKDGEPFTRKVSGYPYNDFRFAIEFIDADRVDWRFDRRGSITSAGVVTNEIRMGVELDRWRRPIAYHVLTTHPTEMGPREHERVDAAEIDHKFLSRRPQQTRGIPMMHAAMAAMRMLGGLEEAELVASRMDACSLGFFTSKTGDEYAGKHDKHTGAIEVEQTPGHFTQLPEGIEPKEWHAQHPNSAFPEFQRALLRGIAVGIGCSYANLTGDLRDVNFSSLRQGVLNERDAWRVLQAFAVQHFFKPLFRGWLAMATLSGQLRIPPPPADRPDFYLDAMVWQPRGFDWVDPVKDVTADIIAIRAGLMTIQEACARRGKDYRDVFKQRAKETALADQLGVVIDLGGAGERAPETAGEGDVPPASPPAKPAQPAAPRRKNGQALLMDYGETVATVVRSEIAEALQ